MIRQPVLLQNVRKYYTSGLENRLPDVLIFIQTGAEPETRLDGGTVYYKKESCRTPKILSKWGNYLRNDTEPQNLVFGYCSSLVRLVFA